MILFLDTEFTRTDLGLTLLSLGLVGDTGVEFYCERNDVPNACFSSFVASKVAPHLGLFPYRIGDKQWCKTELELFLGALGARNEVACDRPEDVELLIDLHGSWPTNLLAPRIPIEQISNEEFFDAQSEYFSAPERPRHHALSDARALHYAWTSIGGLTHRPS